MIIRAADPNANDLGYQVKTVLGKLCAESLSTKTKMELMDKLSALLKDMPLAPETFEQFGLACRIRTNPDKTEDLIVSVPKEFVCAIITENRDNQVVVFGIRKHLVTDSAHDTSTVKIVDPGK